LNDLNFGSGLNSSSFSVVAALISKGVLYIFYMQH
jgi:hypothetical protein